jgi:hypothetical protein
MFSSRDRLVRHRLRELFVVTMLDGSGWRGVLYAADDSTVVLREAEAMSDNARGPVDGELLLPRDHIAYMQRP